MVKSMDASLPICVIGLNSSGPAGLPGHIRNQVERAVHIWGSERLLAAWPDLDGKTHPIPHDLEAMAAEIREAHKDGQVVVLASGDPGFFGIGASLLRYFNESELEIIPQVSSLQEAFARLSLPWSGAHFTSVHARPLAELVGLARRFAALGVLTSPENPPGKIARLLRSASLADCRAVVVENMGESGEAVTDTRLYLLVKEKFNPLNVLLLLQDPGWEPAPALLVRSDEDYRHKKDMITRADVRTLALARLELNETSIVWDIGAGSGAVSLECAWLAWRGKVYAVEKDGKAMEIIEQNIATFGAENMILVSDEAPEALAELPRPDAVFIGGSGGRLEEILDAVCAAARPGCRLVLSLVVLEHVTQTLIYLERAGWNPQVTQVSLSNGRPLGGGMRFVPANPVFLVQGRKPEEGGEHG